MIESRYNMPDVDNIVSHDDAAQAKLEYNRYVGVEVLIRTMDETRNMAHVTKKMKND